MKDYDIFRFPPSRKVVVDAGYLGTPRHVIYGLIEVDVTEPRRLIGALSAREGTRISFTAFVVATLGRAIAAMPEVQACRDWRGRLVVFHHADVVTMIEPQAGKVAIPHIIRRANGRSVLDISSEIRSVQAQPRSSGQSGGLVTLARRVPRFVRMLFYWALKKNPHLFREKSGTAVLTSIGMFGKGGGWGIGFLPLHTLGVTVGGIVEKPGVHEGTIAIREYLQVTLTFDHDIVDGAPAARFARRFTSLLESGAVLPEVS